MQPLQLFLQPIFRMTNRPDVVQFLGKLIARKIAITIKPFKDSPEDSNLTSITRIENISVAWQTPSTSNPDIISEFQMIPTHTPETTKCGVSIYKLENKEFALLIDDEPVNAIVEIELID